MPRPANLETRSRLLEKGAELVGYRGYNATGVQEITAAAGVPKGSFYHYFASKEAFAVEILDQYCTQTFEQYGAALGNRDLPPLARVRQFFTDLSVFHQGKGYAPGCLIGNMALEVTASSALVRNRLNAIYREWTGNLAETLAEAQRNEELGREKDPQALARAMIDAFEGAVMRAKVMRDPEPFRTFEDVVLRQMRC